MRRPAPVRTPAQTSGPKAPRPIRSTGSAHRAPAGSLPGAAQTLQRALGNRGLARMLGAQPLQPRLEVSQPHDEYEQEADRVADEVMRMPEPAAAVPPSGSPPRIQRLCAACEEDVQRNAASEEDEEPLMPAREGAVPDARAGEIEPYVDNLDGRGEPLAPSARAFMEPRFGADFGTVRVHADAEADRSARSVDALAFTVGRDIVFRAGRYDPDTEPGRRLLAHELTHVVQQGAVRPGVFRAALGQLDARDSSERLAERAATLADPQPGLTPAPRGMLQRCPAGCQSCSSPEPEEDAGKQIPPPAPVAPAPPSIASPTHAVGPDVATAGPKIVRLAWTVDDGPTRLTPGMSATLSPRAATWFIMSNQLGTGAARASALTGLATRQRAGDEIGIHSMHPTVAHSAWFPIHLGSAVPQGYTATADAMTDLRTFAGELRAGGLNVHFARMPGGELTEVKKYVEDQGGAATSSDGVARALLAGTAPPVPAPTAVATDVALVMSTLRALNLHLWSGSASGPEVSGNTWEAESSGVAARTDDVVRRFTGVVDALARGTRTRPGSFIILAHDTTQADVTHAGVNIAAMETYAITNGVRVEYYRMADLYQILRGSPP